MSGYERELQRRITTLTDQLRSVERNARDHSDEARRSKSKLAEAEARVQAMQRFCEQMLDALEQVGLSKERADMYRSKLKDWCDDPSTQRRCSDCGMPIRAIYMQEHLPHCPRRFDNAQHMRQHGRVEATR